MNLDHAVKFAEQKAFARLAVQSSFRDGEYVFQELSWQSDIFKEQVGDRLKENLNF